MGQFGVLSDDAATWVAKALNVANKAKAAAAKQEAAQERFIAAIVELEASAQAYGIALREYAEVAQEAIKLNETAL